MLGSFATALGVQLGQQLDLGVGEGASSGGPSTAPPDRASDGATATLPQKRVRFDEDEGVGGPSRLASASEVLDAIDGLGEWHSGRQAISSTDIFATLGDPIGGALGAGTRRASGFARSSVSDAAMQPPADRAADLVEEDTRDERWSAGARVALPIYAAVTVGEAMMQMQQAIKTQVERAKMASAPAQEAIDGDNATRIAFLTLFHVTMQRRIFMQTYTRDLLPRMRCLFGSPPYGFLRRNDLDALQAKAISSGRANIGVFAEQGHAVVGWGQFGYSHLVDQHGRSYRLDQAAVDPDVTPIALYAVRAISQGGATMKLIVRIGRRTRQARQKLQAREDKAQQIVFPTPGERLEMEEDERLCQYMVAERGDTVEPRRYTMIVLRTHRRRKESATGEVEVRLQ